MVIAVSQSDVETSFIFVPLFIRRGKRFQDRDKSLDFLDGFKNFIKVIIQQRIRWCDKGAFLATIDRSPFLIMALSLL